MFFLHELEKTVTIHPSFFGPNIHGYIENTLLKEVEGTHQDNYYIVCVLNEWECSEGRVIPGSAFAEYTVHYRAVVWRPFKGEIMDGQVSSVVTNGFFVEIGPLAVFVSKSQIPSDTKFDPNATPPAWTNHTDVTIEKGTHVRVRIKGMRVELGSMYAIATINEDYLGALPS